jgi:hypothetical protein
MTARWHYAGIAAVQCSRESISDSPEGTWTSYIAPRGPKICLFA